MGIIANLVEGGPLDIWTFGAALVASAFLGMRSQMLRPEFHTVIDAPMLVWASLSGLSIACFTFALSIAGGAVHALGREAVLATVIAFYAGVMFFNLRRQSKGGAALTIGDEPR